jgi:glycogen synthase
VITSLTETLGLVVLEAMASGIPVIATPAGGIADHLRHDENGLAFPAGDVREMAHAMVRLVMNPGLRDRLARGARRTAEGLDWEGELDRLCVSYREVCAAHQTATEDYRVRAVGGPAVGYGLERNIPSTSPQPPAGPLIAPRR